MGGKTLVFGRTLLRVIYGARPGGSVSLPLLLGSMLVLAPGLAGRLTPQSQPSDPLSLQLERPYPGEERSTEALARLERAIEVWNDGDPLQGALLVDSVLASLPSLYDWRPLVVAELRAAAGDTLGTRSALEAIDSTGEYWSRWGWIALTDAYEAAGDLSAASDVARSQARIERNPSRASDAWARAGRLSLEAGDAGRAAEDLWAALDYGARYEGAQRAAVLIDQAGWSLDGRDELRLGRALLAARSWNRGLARLQRHVSDDFPGASADQDELRLDVGRALFEVRRFSEAESILSPLLGDDTAPDLRSPARYWSGRAMLSRSAGTEAESILRTLAEAEPDSPWAERGLSVLLARELETGFGPRARGFLSELLRVGVASVATGTTVVQLGSTQYLSRDYLSAATTFEQYLEGGRSSSTRQQAGYWAALSHERAGRDSDARSRLAEVYEENPLSYYGVFAGERIGAPVLSSGIPDGPAPIAGLELEMDNALLRLRVHQLVPTAGSFAYELGRLTEYFSERGRRYEFAEALIQGGLPLQAIVLGRRIRAEESGWNVRLLRIVHPFPYREVILREAQERDLDPFFVAGLIRQASGFDARIESASGAVGLMQLMPPTAREMAEGLGLSYRPARLREPDYNLRLGIRYLASLVRRFDARAEEVLSAYNAGPTRMRNWRGEPTYQDRDVFMEHIPFRETRNYVKAVQGYSRIYSALYGCGTFEPCLGLSYPTLVARSSLAGGSPLIALTRR